MPNQQPYQAREIATRLACCGDTGLNRGDRDTQGVSRSMSPLNLCLGLWLYFITLTFIV